MKFPPPPLPSLSPAFAVPENVLERVHMTGFAYVARCTLILGDQMLD